MADNRASGQGLPFSILSHRELTHDLYRGAMSTLYVLEGNPDVVLKLYLRREGVSEGTGEISRDGSSLKREGSSGNLIDYASFTREFSALEVLSHPNIVEACGGGVMLSGTSAVPYMILTRFRGRTLREIIEAGEDMSLGTIASIVREVAKGLGYAHQQGMINKDVKPSNILYDGKRAIVVDFGLAEPLPEPATEYEMVLGTPQYMSPEQAKGDMLDQRTDIYALGITLYYAAARVIPFDETESAYEVLRRKIFRDVVDPRLFNPRLPLGLAKIILLATERDPRRRYFTMDDLIGDIDTFLLKI